MHEIPHFHDAASALSKPVLREIQKHVIVRHFKSGDIIIHQGEPVEAVYRVVSGRIKISSYIEDGREIILSGYNSGDTFGEASLIQEFPAQYSAECLCECEINVLPKNEFLKIYQQYPEVSYQVSRKLVRQVRMLYSLLLEAKSLSLEKRLVSSIFRSLHSHTVRDKHGLYLEMSQDEMARALGTARQSINRELKKLEAGHFIELSYGKVYLTNLEALREQHRDILTDEFIRPVYED